MSNDELFLKVKMALSINNNALDEVIRPYYDSAIAYLKFAGVNQCIILSPLSVAVIARYINDLWNYGSGDCKLSDMFITLCNQLVLMSESGRGE